MNAAGGEVPWSPCVMGAVPREEVFYVDVDGDAANELFIAWTYYIGAGHDGAVEQLEVCGWRWTGAGLTYLAALSEELTTLAIRDAPAASAFLAARAAGGPEWVETPVVQEAAADPRRRVYTIGATSLTMIQTGSYFVSLGVTGSASMKYYELVGMTPMDLDGAAQRTWDFTESWGLRTIGGEPDCCAFDLSPAAAGAPRLTRAWTHSGSIYAILRQEQSKVTASCRVLQISGDAISSRSQCEAFLEQRAAGRP